MTTETPKKRFPDSLKVFLVIITLIFIGSTLWGMAEHDSKDPATVTNVSGLYTGTCDTSGLAHGQQICYQGTIAILDHANNVTYHVAIGCNYYQVGMNVTLYITENDVTNPTPTVQVWNPPTGCHGFVNGSGSQ